MKNAVRNALSGLLIGWLVAVTGCSAAQKANETTVVNGGLGFVELACLSAQFALGAADPPALALACGLDAKLTPAIQAYLDGLLAAQKAGAAKAAKLGASPCK